MTYARPARRALIAAASLTALLAAAACGGGGGNTAPAASAPAGADFSKTGDTEFWAGKDVTGNTKSVIDRFNAQSTTGKVTFHELPALADAQRQQMIQNTQIKNPAMGIVSMDVVWTAEFAAKGIVEALPAEQFPTTGMLPAVVDSATYFGKLYGYPNSSDGGMLYHRTDLLKKYNLQVPTTWDEMKAACKTIIAGENSKDLNCYGGQFNKYEGLTVNFAEAVDTAGGSIIGADGKPSVSTPEAAKGLQTIVDAFKDGTIPKGAITWAEAEGLEAFQKGNLVFLRNWPYAYSILSRTDGSSDVEGKFAVAPLPGLGNGPGVSSLGGHNYAVAKYADAKGTAAAFVKFTAGLEEQKQNQQKAGAAPVSAELYADAELNKKYPYLPVLLKSIESAKPRPKAVEYGDVSLAIQDAAYAALQGQKEPQAALADLQAKLQTVIK
jgi:multiple sugar transport system substrate-binding protein